MRPTVAVLLATTVALVGAAPATAATSGAIPLAVDVDGTATITSRWIEQERCAQGYRADLVQRVTVTTPRPVRTRAFEQGNVFFTDQPTAGPVTATTKRTTWAALPPLGCTAGLLEPKPVPPKTACPAINGRFEASLTRPPARGDQPELEAPGTPDSGATLLLVLTRQTGPRSVSCSPDLPPANTAPVGNEDAEGASVVAAMPWRRREVFVSFPLKGGVAVVIPRRKREWRVRVSGDCDDLNIVDRGSREQPGPDGDEISCVVKGEFRVSIRNLQR